MTSLDDAFGGRRDQRQVAQLVLGGGLLFAGSVIFGLGFVRVASDALAAVGIAEGMALAVAAAAVGLLVPGALVAIRMRLPGDRGQEWLAPGGGLVGFSVLAFLATAAGTGTVPTGTTAWVLGVAYAVGVGIVGGSVLAATFEPGSRRPRVSYQRATARHDGPTPADGGEDEDDDLSFPLDEE